MSHHTLGYFWLILSSHPKFSSFRIFVMHTDEDLLPRSKSPIAHPEPSASPHYFWLECSEKGWQVLSMTPNDLSFVPNPPKCVIKSRSRSKSGTPRKKASFESSPDTNQARRVVSPHVLCVEQEDASSPLAEKNFVLANIRNISSPKRRTRSSLLEQASNQLRESEMVCASLAERLNVIQTRLSN